MRQFGNGWTVKSFECISFEAARQSPETLSSPDVECGEKTSIPISIDPCSARACLNRFGWVQILSFPQLGRLESLGSDTPRSLEDPFRPLRQKVTSIYLTPWINRERQRRHEYVA